MAIIDDISSGLYKLINQPFQVEAWVFPFRYVPVRDVNGDVQEFATQQPYTVTTLEDSNIGEYLEAQLPNLNWTYYLVVQDFDLDTFAVSEFNAFMNAQHILEKFPTGAEQLTFNPLIKFDRDLSALELANLSNVKRIQWHDDDLHPANSLVDINGNVWTDGDDRADFTIIDSPSIIGIGGDYFDAKKLDANFDNILLSIDAPPFNYTAAQWTDYINRLQPDLITYNEYPWQVKAGLNYRQVEYGMYSRAIYWNRQAQAGGDKENPVAKSIPFGAYLQTYYADKTTIMSYSYRKYQAYFNLTFGAKFLSAFIYNDYPNDHTIGLESYLFDQKGVPQLYEPLPTDQFYEQAELNRQIKNIGNTLRFLNPTGQRFIRATNIEHFVQSDPFDGGIFDWDFGTRPDTRITDLIVSRDDSTTTQDVWIGYFNPIHNSLDGSGTADESYFMICNGSWDEDTNVNIRQRVRMEFDFGADSSIKNLIKLSKRTGFLEVIELIPIVGNTYYYEHVLQAGEADLFKFDTGVTFIGDPLPQVEAVAEGAYFNLPFGVRVSNDEPIDADRYIQNTIAERNLLVTQGRAKEGQQCYVLNQGDNTSETFILRGSSIADWRPIWESPNQLADMYKSTYDTNDSGVVDNAELLSGRQLNELAAIQSVVSRDISGDIEARLLKSTFTDAISINSTAAIMFRNSALPADNFLRPITRGGFIEWLQINTVYTVATLPTGGSAIKRAFVSDSSLSHNGPNTGSIVTAGGANFVPVYFDGTNWKIG